MSALEHGIELAKPEFGKLVFMGCDIMQNGAVIYCTTMQIIGRAVNGQALRGNIAKSLSPTADSQVSRMALVVGQGWGMKGTEFELPGRRPRKGRVPCSAADISIPIRSAVTDRRLQNLVTDLVPAGRDEFCC